MAGIPSDGAIEVLPEPIAVLLRVVEILERLQIPYLVSGSIASSVLGEPRSTVDVDIVVDMQPLHVWPLVEAMRPEFYIDDGAVTDAVARGAAFNVIHLHTMQKVDIFVVAGKPHDQEQMRRRQPLPLSRDPERFVYFLTAEDLILQKLSWYRLGAGISDRQWRDILGVMKVQAGRLDRVYLFRWAESLQLSDLLGRAMQEAGLS